MRESGLQRFVIQEIRRRGWYAVTTCPPVESGTPDVLACVAGRFVGIEVKTEEGKPSKLQSYRLKQIHQAGGTATIVRSRRQLRDLLSLLESSKPSGDATASLESET